jgi:DNA-directed RNA polymerase specialized sigma24 family protein
MGKHFRELERLAYSLAHRYDRSTGWRGATERRDLEQEAMLGVLEAERSWDPERAPLDKHAMMTVIFRLRRYTWRAGLPVSAPHGHEDKAAGCIAEQEGMLADRLDHPWARLEERARWEQVCDALDRAIARADPSGAAGEVMLGGQTAKEVSETRGVTYQRIGVAIRRAIRHISRDEEVRDILGIGE